MAVIIPDQPSTLEKEASMNEQTIHPESAVELNSSDSTGESLIRREDTRLLPLLRSGDEWAFLTLVERLHGQMMRIALHYVSDRQIAEEVIQDTWVGVLRSLANF